jgi:16S rRNA (uracil1498-N3)-methyltransferase
MAERSEKKSLNEERLKKIAIEASEQSGRSDVPTIGQIMKLEDVILATSGTVNLKRLVFHTEGLNFATYQLTNNAVKTSLVGIFIGPEGGWSEKEIELFHKNNMDIVCLGNQVLRSETAVIAALSRVVLE